MRTTAPFFFNKSPGFRLLKNMQEFSPNLARKNEPATVKSQMLKINSLSSRISEGDSVTDIDAATFHCIENKGEILFRRPFLKKEITDYSIVPLNINSSLKNEKNRFAP